MAGRGCGKGAYFRTRVLQTRCTGKRTVKQSGTARPGNFEPGTGSKRRRKRVQNGFSTRQSETMEMTGFGLLRKRRAVKARGKQAKGGKEHCQHRADHSPGKEGQNPLGVTENKFWNFIPGTDTKPQNFFCYGPYIQSEELVAGHCNPGTIQPGIGRPGRSG